MIEDESWADDMVESTCDECGEPVVPGKEISCRCDRYENPGHGDVVFCSDQCLWAYHEK